MVKRTSFPFGKVGRGDECVGELLPFHPRYRNLGDGLIVDFSAEIDLVESAALMRKVTRSRPAESIIDGLIPEKPPISEQSQKFRMDYLADDILERFIASSDYSDRDEDKLQDIYDWLVNFGVALDLKVLGLAKAWTAYYRVKWINDTHMLVVVKPAKEKTRM